MNGVYRTPGRAAESAHIPLPSWRTLLAPIGLATAYVTLVVLAIALFNWFAPTIFAISADIRFIPAVDAVQDGLSVALLASLPFVVARVVRRVRPSWGGLRLWSKVLYVVALLVAQSAVVVGAEAAIFCSRGGLHLFEPSHLSSTWLPGDGRTAHVYSVGGLKCGYDVFVSGPFSLTATRALTLSRATCLEPTPRVQWNANGSVGLVDSANKALESQSSPSFSFWGGGC